MSGDRLLIHEGQVSVEGRALPEPYVAVTSRDNRSAGPLRVGTGRYFVMGDELAMSCDSREWGALPRDHVIGRAIAVYWPPRRIRRL